MLKEKDNLPFRENLRKHTLDISVGSLMFLVFSFMIYERVSGVLPVSGKNEPKTESFSEIKRSNTVLFNDSIRQRIH